MNIFKLDRSIIGMYEKGMSTRDIATQVNKMYSMYVSQYNYIKRKLRFK